MEEKCFADYETKCGILVERNCVNCSFRKSRAQFNADRQKYIAKEKSFYLRKKENPDC